MASKENPSVNKNCPVSATIRLIGGKYKALLLWHLTGQTLRFNQLHRLVPEATPKMLTQQLRELEEDGLISRTVYPVVPPAFYLFTTFSKRCIVGQRPDAGQKGLTPACTMTDSHAMAASSTAFCTKCRVAEHLRPRHAAKATTFLSRRSTTKKEQESCPPVPVMHV